MSISNRFFQISLRTIFEVTFVVAVVSAFLYWRSRPTGETTGTGRFQLHVDANDVDRQYLFDTQTGPTWYRSPDSVVWRERGRPPESTAE
jgi:hypothetical protein